MAWDRDLYGQAKKLLAKKSHPKGPRELARWYHNNLSSTHGKLDEDWDRFRTIYFRELGQMKENPRRRTMKLARNSSAKSKWGVYVKGQLAYVSGNKLDANKAATKLRASGRRFITQKAVGPNPISGKVPPNGWRKEFKKAAYAAMKSPAARRKRARTTSKIRQTRERRGENPKRKSSKRQMDVFDKHQYRIAKDTLRMADAMVGVMGGPSKAEAREIIKRLDAKYKRNPGENPGTFYEVIVSNIGKVHEGNNAMKAYAAYQSYVKQSKSGRGRAAGEDVSLWKNNEPIKEHFGTNTESNPGPARGVSARAVSGRVGRQVSRLTPTRGYMGRNAGIGTRAVTARGRLRNPTGFYKVWFTGPAGETAGVVVTTDKYPKGKTSIGTYSRLFPFSESGKMTRIYTSKIYPTFEDAFRHPKGPTSSGSGPRRRNASSVLRRRTNPKSVARSSNPRPGYVVQVGNSVAWVGKLASDAQKAIRHLMNAGFKSVKGFEAKLSRSLKLGWRKQYSHAARKRNSHFRGKLGTGTRFDNCVKKMSKRKGVYDPQGLCAAIGDRKYGVKRMTRMAVRGRRRNSGRGKYRVASSRGVTYHGTSLAAIKAAKTAVRTGSPKATIYVTDDPNHFSYRVYKQVLPAK